MTDPPENEVNILGKIAAYTGCFMTLGLTFFIPWFIPSNL
jgi:hypothetical protein